MKKAVIIIVILLVIAGGVFAFMQVSGDDDANNSTSNTSQQSSSNSSSDDSQSNGSTIKYNGTSFSPATLTVVVGTNITIVNNSSKTLQFDSDPHPVHTDEPELNVDIVEAGQSKTFTVTNVGTHGYHNHLNSSQTGTVVVE